MHSFDLVSDDNHIVAEVKSHQMTKGGNIPSGKISDTYHACSMLEKAKAEKKLLLLTDRSFYDVFKRYSDGKISEQIRIILINEEKKSKGCLGKISVTSKKKKENILVSKSSDFEVFWSELVSWLSKGQKIKNWTLKSGALGEDFEAGTASGSCILVSPPSALKSLRVPKRDFELLYENWTHYLEQRISRGELAKKSRFTKYTISIIQQFLNL